MYSFIFFFSSRRRHTILQGDWSSDVCSSDLEQVGQLANGRRLAGAVHADDQRHLRMMAVQHRLLHRVEDLADLVLDEVAQTFAATGAGPDRGDDSLRGSDADVGGDEQLLQRFDGIDIDRTGTLLAGVGPLDDLVEPADNLLLRAAQTFTKPI